MIVYLVICITTFLISILTLFSGFGLGTVLMPVFAIFFPLPLAIAATAVVHLVNNLFKTAIVGKFANWDVVIKFGVPAAIFSAFGAFLLGIISNIPPLMTYYLNDYEFKVTPIGLSVGLIIVLSSIFELVPKLSILSFKPIFIPVGGALSGFFGGISGNQGIFRSAFLIKSGLNKEEFIGTSVICSIIVDVIRLTVYGWAYFSEKFVHILSSGMQEILIAASLAALFGTYLGTRLMNKITFKTIQIIVGVMLLVLGLAIAAGIV